MPEACARYLATGYGNGFGVSLVIIGGTLLVMMFLGALKPWEWLTPLWRIRRVRQKRVERRVLELMSYGVLEDIARRSAEQEEEVRSSEVMRELGEYT